MYMYFYFGLGIATFSIPMCSCWQYYATIADVKLQTNNPTQKVTHGEYIFGKCKIKKNVLYTRTRIHHMHVLGRIIVRGWIEVPRIPTCIRLRGLSHPEDQLQTTSYQFQICVPRISYIYSQHIRPYYFYEWFIPWDFAGGMDWEISFYGAPGNEWWYNYYPEGGDFQ